MLPYDEEELLQAFDRLGAEARYMRFMSSIQHLNVERLRAVLDSFPERGLALAAKVPAADGIDIVGTASFVIDGKGGCEFAIAILSEWAGAGLGRALMEILIEGARERGLERMHGFVLAANQPMLRLAARLGFAVKADPDDFSIRIVRLEL